jgi:hypothetical protein
VTARPISDAALRYGWQFVLCKAQGSPKAKDPWTPEGHHEYRDLDGARQHFARGFNVGLVGRNLTVLDWDDGKTRLVLFEALGPLPLTVETGSGKFHTYVASDPSLPGTIWSPSGTAAGQVRRLPTEYVVCPPSVHPNGKPYRCLLGGIDLAPLPELWRRYLLAAQPAHDRGEGFTPPDSISEGERHRTFFRWTRSLKLQCYTLDQVLDILKLVNEAITHPPLDERHLANFVTRCYDQPDRPGFGGLL